MVPKLKAFIKQTNLIKVLSDDDFKPEKLYTGEPARLNSLKTQRPPFDVKNPYMAPIKVRFGPRSPDGKI